MTLAHALLDQPRQEDFLHHRELIDVNIKHRFQVLARNLFKSVDREEPSCCDHHRNVQIFNLLPDSLIEGWCQTIMVCEVNLDNPYLSP